MAPSAKSRKGKKAWRKNIDASEVETFLEEETYQQRRGPAAKELQDDQLFFVDKAADDEGAAAAAEGKRPAKRRREEAAARPLRAELIIAEAHKAKPLTLAPPPRKQSAATAAAAAEAVPGKGLKSALALVPSAKNGSSAGAGGRKGRHPLDLWADDDMGLSGAVAEPAPASTALVRQSQELTTGQPQQARKAKKAVDGRAQATAVVGSAVPVRWMGPSAKPLRKSPPPPRIKAVAVDIPGCSFNPDDEQHQDAIALLVAAEVKKELRKELLPTAPPLEVEAPDGRPMTELEMLQVEAGYSDDDEDEGPGQQQRPRTRGDDDVADPNAIALADGEDGDGGDDDEAGPGDAKKRKAEKKSKKERLREARRKAAEAELEERRKLKAQRRELQSLKDLKAQLEEEEREKENRRLRKLALREERAAVEPPRLGKLRFEAPSVQVLTSDEKTGSLRKVVPCAMLAADRFKSLQQRGLVEPRKPQPFKEKRRKVTYEKGARFERAEAASAEVRELSHTNKKARRRAKAAEAAGRGLDDGDW